MTCFRFANDFDATVAVQLDMRDRFFRLAEESGLLSRAGEVTLIDLNDDQDAKVIAESPALLDICHHCSSETGSVHRFASSFPNDKRWHAIKEYPKGVRMLDDVPRCAVFGSLRRCELEAMAIALADPK